MCVRLPDPDAPLWRLFPETMTAGGRDAVATLVVRAQTNDQWDWRLVEARDFFVKKFQALGILALLVLAVLPFEYMPGLWTCPRGYVIRSGQCLADAEVTHGPVMEVSTLPSAGDGAPGTVCPSGGCSVLRDYNSTYVHVYQHRAWRWR